MCVDDKFSKPFKTYSGENAVYNFTSNMRKESKYCGDMIKKYFNIELVMIKEGYENFKNSTKWWMRDSD